MNHSMSKIAGAVAFGAALLLFLFPFAALKFRVDTKGSSHFGSQEMIIIHTITSSVSIQTTGLAIATGGGWKVKVGLANPLLGDGLLSRMQVLSVSKVNIFGLAALLLAATGLVFSLLKYARAGIISFLAGILAIIALGGLHLDIMGKITPFEYAEVMDVSIRPTVWFLASILLLAAAAFFSFKKLNVKEQTTP